jgi:hypothetical protein
MGLMVAEALAAFAQDEHYLIDMATDCRRQQLGLHRLPHPQH